MSFDWTLLVVADAALLILATLLVVILFLRDLRRGRTDADPAEGPPFR